MTNIFWRGGGAKFLLRNEIEYSQSYIVYNITNMQAKFHVLKKIK